MGLFVRSVVSGSPADKAGIQQGDLVTEVNGTPISDDVDMQDILSGEHDPQHALAGLCEFRAARHLPDLIPTIAHFNRPFGR